MLAAVKSALIRARRRLEARARSTWNRDRARMSLVPALANRASRIAFTVAYGVVFHRLGMLAAALTYYTVFSIVPTLAAVLWILRALDYLPAIAAELPATPQLATGNDLLYAALRRILEAVDRTSEITTGLVGLGVLLFAVTKMFKQTERALYVISGGRERAPRLSRLLGYVALLLMPPVAVAISGLTFALLRGSLGARISGLVSAIPGIELALGTALALATLWLAATLFYWAAVRAHIPFRSAAVGGAVAAVALPAILWAFAALQIGVTQASAVGSGFLALPVFLVWAFSSWSAVLVGAEIAVAHRMDSVLIHGAAAFRLDPEGERQTGAAIMARATRAAQGAPGARVVTEDALARELRLPPHIVRDLCLRLAERGLLAREPRGFSLGCDPDRTPLEKVIDAVERDPALEAVHDEALARFQPPARQRLSSLLGPPRAAEGGPSLTELAEQLRSASLHASG